MATTPKGYPYPVGTDRVMDGDDAIHAVGTALDSKLGYGICSGNVTLPAPGSTETVVSASVTFPVGLFTVPPIGLACLASGGNANFYPPGASGITASGMTVYCARRVSASNTIGCSWLAHGG